MIFLPYAFTILFVFLVFTYGPAAWRRLKGIKLQNLSVRPRVRASDLFHPDYKGPDWLKDVGVSPKPVVWTVKKVDGGWLARANGKAHAVSQDTITWYLHAPPHSQLSHELNTKFYHMIESQRVVERVGTVDEERAT